LLVVILFGVCSGVSCGETSVLRTERTINFAEEKFVSRVGFLWATFVFPFALTGIGWKIYLINGAWDVLTFGIMAVWWVETKGRTLEELDEVLEGVKHTDVPDLEIIVQGKALEG